MPGEYVAALERKLTRAASAEKETSRAEDSSCSPAAPAPPVPPMRRMPRRNGLAGRPKLGLSIAPIGLPDRLKPELSDEALSADDPNFARENEYLAKPQSSYQRMSMILNDSTLSHKVESMDSLGEGDVLIRMSKIPSDARTLNRSGHDDLVIHTAFLFVEKKSTDDFEFARVEMREASSLCNLIGFNDKYQMALNLDETRDKKPGIFLEHGLTYKIRTASDKHTVKQRFDRAIANEIRFIRKNQYVYGSGIDGHYNCNTFVANVLVRACKVPEGGGEGPSGSESANDNGTAGADCV